MRNVFHIYSYPLVLALFTLIQLFQDDRQAMLSYSDKQYDSFEILSNVLQGYSSMTTVFGSLFTAALSFSLTQHVRCIHFHIESDGKFVNIQGGLNGTKERKANAVVYFLTFLTHSEDKHYSI